MVRAAMAGIENLALNATAESVHVKGSTSRGGERPGAFGTEKPDRVISGSARAVNRFDPTAQIVIDFAIQNCIEAVFRQYK